MVLSRYIHHALEPDPAYLDVANVDQDAISSQLGGDVNQHVSVLAVWIDYAIYTVKNLVAGVEAD
jgi:hypothetical protein